MRRLKRLLGLNRHIYRWTAFGRNLLRFLLGRPHDPDFYAFALFNLSGSFLDIGANTGQSALSFRVVNQRSTILSVEANPGNMPELRIVGRLLRNFDFLICAAGEEPGRATLHLPVYRGLPLSGEASLVHGTGDTSWWAREAGVDTRDIDMREVEVEVRRLDDLALQPAFVKIDVEGAEPQVLRGLTETVARHRPIFLIEDADDVHEALMAFFSPRHYRALEFARDENRLREPVDRSARNLFFVPQERAPELT